MSSENTVADRLLTEARKKSARHESPILGKAALIVGAIAVLVSPISILGWVVGTAAIDLGGAAAAVRSRPSRRRSPLHSAWRRSSSASSSP